MSDETIEIKHGLRNGAQRRIGRYIVDGELGRGTMGVVYAAHDSVLGRTVALKTIELAFAVGPAELADFEQRFFTEARIAAKLSHPGIVVCHDVGKDAESGKFFIVFEHLKGRTLGSLVASDGAVEWRDAVSIVAKLAWAIHHAHEHGVVHRDLKPANIMLLASRDAKREAPGWSGEARSALKDVAVKIMDFGVAKMETSRVKLTATGQSFGSPLYMSPEQALGAPSDARSDVFSLGTVLCTLLLGRPYFDAENIPKILARVIREEPPELSRLVPGVPPDLDLVIARTMAKRIDHRYDTAQSMAHDLEDVLDGHAPRHASAWVAPADGLTTLAGDHDALLAELTGPGQAIEADAHTDPVDALASLLDGTIAGRTLRRMATPRRRALLAVPFVLVAAIGAFFALREIPPATTVSDAGRAPEASPPSPSTQASPDPMSPPAEGPGKGDTATAPAVSEEARPAPEEARPIAAPEKSGLRLQIEHSLKNGRLSLWLDGALTFETPLEARVSKKIVAVRLLQGRLDETLQIEPGKHHVRVEVSWDDNRRSEETVGTFEPKKTHELAITLGRLKKNLSLEWK